MKLGEAGRKLIQSFEQCRLKAYKPTPDDVWTCGWGSTQGVTEDTVWTQEEADEAFLKDMEWVEKCVNESVRGSLTQNEYDALCSLVFNIGCKAFKSSTLLGMINAGNFESAALQFRRWNKQAGKELAGLTRRRAAEERLFETA